jgi:hypothetical protein
MELTKVRTYWQLPELTGFIRRLSNYTESLEVERVL